MNISKIGFGTYRVVLGNIEHELSLKKALLNGINLVDTSSNYTGGLSEQLIGKVLQDVARKISREDITIVSKYGYIHGEVMKRYNEGFEIPEIVPFHQNYYHSIHPDFMRDQLKQSLDRLQTDYVDVYLLHNPEYYLIFSIKSEEEKEEHQKEMLRRIGEAFTALEGEVKKGTIRSYGISSNSFGKAPDDLHFLPYEGLIDMAKEAAKKAGNNEHSFSTVQMPGNLLETESLKGCASWAAKQGLNVLINRPLNAIEGDDLYRLATYPRPESYREKYDEIHKVISEMEDPDSLMFLEEMNNNRGLLKTINHYEYILFHDIIPFFRRILHNSTDEKMALANRFLEAYEKEAMFGISRNTLAFLKKRDISVKEPIQFDALEYLIENPDVTCVLLGMKKREYVREALKILNEK